MSERWAPIKQSLRDFWAIFRRNRMGMIGAFLLITALAVATLAPVLTPYEPAETIRDADGRALTFAPPSIHGPLGTDDAGRDIWTQLAYGARVSLLVGFLAGFISVGIGSLIGMLAGYFGGRVDTTLMRFTDVLLVIPDIPLMIVLVATLRNLDVGFSPIFVLILVVGALYWTGTARLIRSQVLSIKERQYVARARAIGAGHWHIIRKHIFPQVMPLIVANTVLIVSVAIIIESGLAFLGLGDPTQPSWGTMLNFAFSRNAITRGAWWFYLPPGFAIVWVSLGCVLLGNVLEEILNPRLTSHHLESGAAMVVPAAEPESQPAAQAVRTGR